VSQLRTAIGLMSGTSMDGIDVALIETDGETVVRRRRAATYAYTADVRRRLAEGIADARSLDTRMARPGSLKALEHDLTVAHADAVAAFLADAGVARDAIDVIGFHGQTVLHAPERGLTVQLGLGDELARLTGCPVAWDLRADDVAAGGQGAPLAPAYHRAMVADLAERPVAVLNIGGVANVTWIGADGELVAFDTGPGNALLDDWMAKTVGAARDEGGAAARAGTAQEAVVSFFLNHAYFAATPPKSLDRNAFFWDLIDGLDVRDGAATLVAMTAGAIARAVDHMPLAPARWVVCGGGRHNAAIMAAIAEAVDAPVSPAEAIGFDGDAVEAEAWAYLAVRVADVRPITFPGTTGAPEPMTGGRMTGPHPSE